MVKSKQQQMFVEKNGVIYQVVPQGEDNFDEEVVKHSRKRAAPATKMIKSVASKGIAKKGAAAKKTVSRTKVVVPAKRAPAANTKLAKTKAVKKAVTKTAAKKVVVPKKTTKVVTKKVAAPKKAKKVVAEVEEPSYVEVEDDMNEQQLAELSAKQEAKLYKKYKKFCKDYEKKRASKDYASLADWKKCDKLFTSAASILVRYKGLKKSDLTSQKHLPQAVDPLRARGEAQFHEALRIAETLSEEDREKLWACQVRNMGVTAFDNLITKKEYADRVRATQPAAAAQVGEEMMIEAAEEQQEEVVEEQEQQMEEQVAEEQEEQITSAEEVTPAEGEAPSA
jgi:hypothetical protein